MRRLVLLLVISGCAGGAMQHVQKIEADCAAKWANKDRFVEAVCVETAITEDPVIQSHRDADLVSLGAAALVAIRERELHNHISRAEAEFLERKTALELNAIKRQRDQQRAANLATSMAAYGQYLQGLAAYQQSIQPQQPTVIYQQPSPSRPINCWRTPAGFTCY